MDNYIEVYRDEAQSNLELTAEGKEDPKPEENWKSVRGTITRVSQKNGKNQKYGIKIDPKGITEIKPEYWLNGYGLAPGKEGDEIALKYEQNGTWYNIKEVIQVKKLSPELTADDIEDFKPASELVEPENKESSSQSLKTQELIDAKDRKSRAILMKCAVDISLKTGELDQESINELYSRLMKTSGQLNNEQTKKLEQEE